MGKTTFPLSHLSDEELLLVAERECSPRRAAKAREHLAQCPACHTRMNALERTLADFLSFHEENVESQSSPEGSSRHTLKARLSEAGRAASDSSSWFPASVMPRELAGACIALLIVAGSVWAMRDVALQSRNQDTAGQLASALPRKGLTPGVARLVRVDALCNVPDSENDPPVNPSLEQAVFSEYGVPISSKGSYEVDYLISPTLGGTNDIQNLWPEPFTSTSWSARAKDDLEDHLHELVCQGKLPLSTAQSEIATDWIAAYKRYFHTDAPLSNAAALILHRAPDEGPATFEPSRAKIPGL